MSSATGRETPSAVSRRRAVCDVGQSTRALRLLAAGLLLLGAAVASAGDASAAHTARSAAPNASLTDDLRDDLDAYLQSRGEAEHVSAAVASVSLPDRRSSIDVSAGTTRYGGSRPVDPDSIQQIGSNTKAFTAVLVLKLEAANRLSIDDTIGKWLPQYPQWRDVTIKRLLNMTSGIPGYDSQPEFMRYYAAHPQAYYSKERLVGYVAKAPRTSGFSYSNTNYVLAEMIIEKAGRSTYARQLYERIIEPLGLRDLYYGPHRSPAKVTAREPAAYFFLDQIPQLSTLVGTDVSRNTLSWARGAGAILGTTRAMTEWERILYSKSILPPKQRAELFGLVSTRTGRPIERTSAADPAGFGLGVEQGTGPKLGTFWNYLGGTFGFRALHFYVPDTGVIIAVGLNSQPTDSQINALGLALYETVLAHGIE
jgi:D-alanyl-D-alanine carboxypeptidase